MIPCLLHEDEHLLVVDKPAGVNTHAPAPFAGEGLYDWLRHREPRWAALATIQRLDKETSGVMVFSKTPAANRSLTDQFATRAVRKKYLLLTDQRVARAEFTARSELIRLGERYASSERPGFGEPAETHFRVLEARAGLTLVEAAPRTGRTHQIRVHAAEAGFPILGDVLYGGTPAARVHLHAVELGIQHPATGAACVFRAEPPFTVAQPADDVAWRRRRAVVDATETDAVRLIHGAADGWPGWHVERLGAFLLSQAADALTAAQADELRRLLAVTGARGAYHKRLNRQVRRAALEETSPQLVLGEAAPERFVIRENAVNYELSFAEGYSVGLFLDQRDNRRRFLTGHVAADFFGGHPGGGGTTPELLNTFAYTCGFSVCAARASWRTTSLDLSKKYLEWGRRNFALNGLDPAAHDFIYGEAGGWLRRLAKKGRAFDAVVLDPPTFSQSKEAGVFRVEKDFAALVTGALGVLKPGGRLLASTNAAEWPPEEFLAVVKAAVAAGRRRLVAEHYFPQPLDFPITRTEPGYLKTLWLRVA